MDSSEMCFHGQSASYIALSTDLREFSLTRAEVQEDIPLEQIASWQEKATSSLSSHCFPTDYC